MKIARLGDWDFNWSDIFGDVSDVSVGDQFEFYDPYGDFTPIPEYEIPIAEEPMPDDSFYDLTDAEWEEIVTASEHDWNDVAYPTEEQAPLPSEPPPITGLPAPTVPTSRPPIVRETDSTLETLGKIVQTAAGAYYQYVRAQTPQGSIYAPRPVAAPPAGTRYDASGRLVSAVTGQPVRIDSFGRVVNASGQVVSQPGARYDPYGRPVSSMTANLPSWALPAGIAAGVAVLLIAFGGRK